MTVETYGDGGTMAYRISEECNGCNTCLPHCPTNAIGIHHGEYWINPALCNNCAGFYPEPQCLVTCPTDVPSPYQAMKGRVKTITARLASSPTLFPDGKNHPFASSIVMWETCNLLSQRHSLPLSISESGEACYHKRVGNNLGSITLSIPFDPGECRQELSLDFLDIRSACLHLIFAAYATGVERPWEQPFIVTDVQLESYLGLDKRKDLSKIARLSLLKTLVEQASLPRITVDWPSQGKVKAFTIQQDPLWRVATVHHHFQKDDLGCNHLIGLTWVIQPGGWSRYFLNRQACRQREAFYQYSSLPLSLLTATMSNWQHHEGAVRMMLWLVFKARMGRKQRITIPTLMRVAYGEDRLLYANANPQERKRLIRLFESDLEILNHYGIKPIFDPVTYPLEIQPLWARLEGIPEDADEALDFWIEDGHTGSRLTATGPRGKWNLLMHARIQQFDLPPDWVKPARTESSPERKGPSRGSRRAPASAALTPQQSSAEHLSGSEITAARQRLGLSQRELARRTGKSQSWIRDIEKERFHVGSADRQLLLEILNPGGYSIQQQL